MKESPQESLASSNQPQSNLAAALTRMGQDRLWRKLIYALRVRTDYGKHGKSWGAGQNFLYRQFIFALGLEAYEKRLMELVQPKPGRKVERELAERIWQLKAEGKTVPQIHAILQTQGYVLTKEAVAEYLKTRRNKPQR